MVGESVEDGGKKVATDEYLDPRSQHQPLAVLGGLGFFALLGHAVLGRPHKGLLSRTALP